jgi:hypothetical protein
MLAADQTMLILLHELQRLDHQASHVRILQGHVALGMKRDKHQCCPWRLGTGPGWNTVDTGAATQNQTLLDAGAEG